LIDVPNGGDSRRPDIEVSCDIPCVAAKAGIALYLTGARHFAY
jgi:hypothetical protein